jgi:hypothetical protein
MDLLYGPTTRKANGCRLNTTSQLHLIGRSGDFTYAAVAVAVVAVAVVVVVAATATGAAAAAAAVVVVVVFLID